MARSFDDDYYTILGLDKNNKKNISQDEITAAYKKKILEVHPDKQGSLSETKKAAANQAFRDVRQAYFILGDVNKRKCYDEGREFKQQDATSSPSQDYTDFLSELRSDPTFQDFFAGVAAYEAWVKKEYNNKITKEYNKMAGLKALKSKIYATVGILLNPINLLLFRSEALQKYREVAVDTYYRTPLSFGDVLIGMLAIAVSITAAAGFLFGLSVAAPVASLLFPLALGTAMILSLAFDRRFGEDPGKYKIKSIENIINPSSSTEVIGKRIKYFKSINAHQTVRKKIEQTNLIYGIKTDNNNKQFIPQLYAKYRQTYTFTFLKGPGGVEHEKSYRMRGIGNQKQREPKDTAPARITSKLSA